MIKFCWFKPYRWHICIAGITLSRVSVSCEPDSDLCNSRCSLGAMVPDIDSPQCNKSYPVYLNSKTLCILKFHCIISNMFGRYMFKPQIQFRLSVGYDKLKKVCNMYIYSKMIQWFNDESCSLQLTSAPYNRGNCYSTLFLLL